MKRIRIFVDGASRNNPGPAGAGIYATSDEQIICKIGYYLGKKTNNQAEYLSLLIALLILQKKFADISKFTIDIFSDSELLVRQISGEYRVKNPEIAKIKTIIDTILNCGHYTITHVLRDKNEIADKLANDGIDKKRKLPIIIMEFLKKHEVNI